MGVQLEEAKRIGIDLWFRLSMNDWHHVDTESARVYRLIGSKFYESNLQYLIGEEGLKGWPEQLRRTMKWFQNYAHPEVWPPKVRTRSRGM